MEADDIVRTFDACLMTTPNRAVLACIPELSEEYRGRLEKVQYLGMVCVALVLRHPVSPYYLTNVTQEAPFTGVIEMTNLIDRATATAGYTLVYLPKYTTPNDPVFRLDDEQVWERFSAAFFHMYPHLSQADIVSMSIFRERYVQPVPTLNYSSHLPGVETGIPHLFVANTSQIVNDTLNNNAMTAIARRASMTVAQDVLGAEMKRHPVQLQPATVIVAHAAL